MKATLAIYREEFREYFAQHLLSFPYEKVIALIVDGNILVSDFGANVTFKKYEDYLSEEELLNVDKDASYWACNWYKDKAVTQLLGGLPWGQLIEYEFREFLGVMFKNIALLEKTAFSRIAVCNDDSLAARIIIRYAEIHNIELDIINDAQSEKLSDYVPTPRNSRTIQKYVRKSVIAVSDLYFQMRRRRKHGCRLIIKPYPHVNAVLDRLIQDDNNTVVIADPSFATVKNYFGKVHFTDFAPPATLSTPAISIEIEQLIDSLDTCFKGGGPSYRGSSFGISLGKRYILCFLINSLLMYISRLNIMISFQNHR